MKITQKLIAVLLAVLLTVTVLPFSVLAKDAAPTRDLLLATVSDVHYYPESLAQYKGEAFYTYLQGANCVYDVVDGTLDAAFDALAKDAADKGLKYVVLCGDLTTNGEYEGHVALAEKLRAFEEASGLQVFVINGNHDINNSDAAQFTTPDGARTPARTTSAKEFYEIYHEFGFDDAVSTFSAPDTGKAGALSYAVSADGYRLIMIDAGRYSTDHTIKQREEHETRGDITDEVLAWVRAQAEAAKAAGETPIAFTHWNLSEMNYFHGELLQGFVIDNAYILQETFADMGIHYVFSGHQHVADLDVTYSDAGEPLYSVITPSLTQFPYCYRETAFSADDKGNVTADFQLYDCDETRIVESNSGAMYMKPFRYSGFYMQFGNSSATDYLMRMVKGLTYKYIDGMQKAGSVVAYLKQEFDLDIEQKIDDLIKGGFSVGDTDIFTTKNIMSFIDDLDRQIMDTYINDPNARLWPAVETMLDNLTHFKMSDEPCTKFLDAYGFGDPDAPGTLGDMLFSVMVYMYYGNEDGETDVFIQDVLKNVNSVKFIDRLFAAAEQYIVEDLLVDEIFAHLYLHINSLFVGQTDASYYVSMFLQIMFRAATGAITENVTSPDSFADFIQKMIAVAMYASVDESSISVKNLLLKVLGTGKLSYGKNVKELVYYFLDQYFPQANKEATAEQIWVLLEGMVHDEDTDWNVNYDYTGPVQVTPTAKDMQIPTNVTMRVENDTFTVHWFTKYSVTGTDIRITDKSTGKAVAAKNVTTETAQDTFTGYGFNFGSFGILPYTQNINVHTASVTGLQAGRTYVYRIGDAEKDFWSAAAEFTVPSAEADSFTFLYFSDFAASNTANARRFASTVRAAAKDNPKAAFALLSGASALNGNDDTQFASVINAASETFASLPVFYVSAAGDLADTPNLIKHYNVPKGDVFSSDLLGSFYSYDYLNAHFVVVNTNDLLSDGALRSTQVTWLREDLEGSSAKWKIVAMDAPVFSGASQNETMEKQLMMLFADLGVDLVLEGGAKAYYRSYLINDTEYLRGGDKIVRTFNGKQYEALVGNGFLAVAPGTSGTSYGIAQENKEKYDIALTQTAPTYAAVTVYKDDVTVETYQVASNGRLTRLDGGAVEKKGRTLMMGDIDLDGSVTAADARLALRYAVELESFALVKRLAADVDKDRAITAADARAILRAAVDLEPIRPQYIEYYQKDLDNIDF